MDTVLWPRGSAHDSSFLGNLIFRLFKVRLFAEWAAPWAGETGSVFKNVSACQTPHGLDYEFLPLCGHRPSNVRQVFIDLFLTDSHILGEFPSIHLFVD